jgi:hypothetical protein
VPFGQLEEQVREQRQCLLHYPQARRIVRAEAQGRRVNTIIKKHLLLKMLFYCKKLSASAPLREITVPTPVNRTTPSTTYCSRRGAGRRVNTFIKRHLPKKCSFIAKSSAPLRLCARSQCLRQLPARPPARRIFRAEAQGRRVLFRKVVSAACDSCFQCFPVFTLGATNFNSGNQGLKSF